MALSVEVKRLGGKTVYVCRGHLVQGQPSEYLFDLITRSDHHDVILDLGEVACIDQSGIEILALSCQFLGALGKSLFFSRTSSDALLGVRKCCSSPVLEWPQVRSSAAAAAAVNRSR